MSSWIRYTASIKNPSIELVKQAVNAIVKLHNGQIVSEVRRYGGWTIPVDLGFIIPGIERGIGIKVENGELVFICDPYAKEEMYDKARAELIKLYKTIAVQKALQSLGYNVNIQQVKDNIVIEGS